LIRFFHQPERGAALSLPGAPEDQAFHAEFSQVLSSGDGFWTRMSPQYILFARQVKLDRQEQSARI